MHVVFDARMATYSQTGIGRYAFEMARALSKLVKLSVIISPAQASTPFLDSAQTNTLVEASPPGSLKEQWRIPKLLNCAKADLYHSPFYRMAYRIPIPRVVTSFDLIPLFSEARYSRAKKIAFWAAQRIALDRANMVIVPSQATYADLVKKLGIRADKIRTIPCGVSEDFTPATTSEIRRLRMRYELPERFVLCVGNPRPHKNRQIIIEAYRRLPGDAPPIVFAGNSDPRFTLKLPSDLKMLEDRIRFLSIDNADLPSLYSAASLFIQPSLIEGFGLPVLEAMACGTPVLCAHSPGLREAAGDAALFFDPYNPQELANQILAGLNHPESHSGLIQKGFQHAQIHRWDQVAQATLNVYRETVATQ